MKSIYKKISVGVLVAGLLVGAGGIAKGGQAFAAEVKGENFEIAKRVIQALNFGGRSEQQIKEEKERDIKSDINLMARYSKLKLEHVGEVGQVRDGIEVESAYQDIFDVWRCEDAHGDKHIKVGKRIQIGLNIYDIKSL